MTELKAIQTLPVDRANEREVAKKPHSEGSLSGRTVEKLHSLTSSISISKAAMLAGVLLLAIGGAYLLQSGVDAPQSGVNPLQSGVSPCKGEFGNKTYGDGSIYKGCLVNGTESGYGIKSMPGQWTYEGDFHSGSPTQGTLTYSNNDVYAGSFGNGVPETAMALTYGQAVLNLQVVLRKAK